MESTLKTESNATANLTEEQIQALLLERGKLLTKIATMEHDKAGLRKMLQAKIDALIPPELLQEMSELEAEFDTLNDQARVAELESQIKNAVLGVGHSVKVEGVGQAVYTKGKTSWNTDGLEGLMIAVPELAKFKTVGKPSVSLR